jgi:inorganic pyrophosphatase
MKLPPTYSKDKKTIHAIIETPCKSRNKFDLDQKSGLFKFKKTLPDGMAFPCDFGFIPGTLGEDGDPLDILILMNETTFPGCLVECRLIGCIKAEQTEKKGKKVRNDRFIAVPSNARDYDHIKDAADINKNKLDAIVSFFENYNSQENKLFKLIEILNAKKAHKVLKKSKSRK